MNVQLTDKIISIFKSTLLLIKQNGFHGTPMSLIAKSSDVAIGTIYHYFPSKDNLIIELFHYSRKQLYDYIFEECDQCFTYKDRFFQVFKRFCDFQIEHGEIACFLEQFYNSPYNETIRKIDSEESNEENGVLKFLLEGMELGVIKELDVRILTAAYIGAAVSYSKTIIFGRVEFDEHQIKDLVEIIWNGVKKD